MVAVLAKAVGLENLSKNLAKLPDKSRKANSMAINTAIKRGRTTVGREIRSKYVISQGRVYKELDQKFANPGNLYGNIVASGGGIPVKDFKVTPKGPKPRAKPVITVEIVKGSPKAAKGWFVIGRFGMHVFTRKGVAYGESGTFLRKSSRFPIEKKISTSVPQMMLGDRAGESIKTQISETYEKEFARQMARILK